MMRLQKSFLFGTATVLWACASPTDVPSVARIETDKSAYAANDAVVLKLTNVSSSAFGYNLCSGLVLQRRSGSDWVQVDGAATPCLGAIFELAPGAIATETFTLPASVSAGTYRFRVAGLLLDRPNADVRETDRLSNEFQVAVP